MRTSSPGVLVLLVDNDPDTRATVRAAVGADATIVTQSQGRRALEALQRTRFDVLVLTLDRPDGTRAALLRHLQGELKPNQIVVLTDWREQATEQQAPGGAVILPKRCSARELRQAMFGSSA